MDSDDALPPDALLTLWGIAQRTGVKIVASRTRFTMYEEPLVLFPKQPRVVDCRIKMGGLSDFVRESKIFSAPWRICSVKHVFRKEWCLKIGPL